MNKSYRLEKKRIKNGVVERVFGKINVTSSTALINCIEEQEGTDWTITKLWRV